MLEIALNNIVKNFGGKNILNNFSLEIYTNERIALVGPNGCGKTTVLSLISKNEVPNSGDISIRNKSTIGLLNQIQKQYNDDYTLEQFLYSSIKDVISYEEKMHIQEKKLAVSNDLEKDLNVYSKMQEHFELMGGYSSIERVSMVKKGLGIKEELLNTSFNKLSGGEKTIAALGSLLIQSPDILLLDEPTNHLDIKTIEWLESFIKGYKGTVVIVSHDRSFLNLVASKIIYIDNGKQDIYFGNYSYFLEERQIRKDIQESIYLNQEKKIDTMKKQAHQLREWAKISDNEKIFKKAKTIEKRINKIDVIEKPNKESKIDISFNILKRTGKDVLSVKGINVISNRLLLSDVTFDIFYQERVGIIGPNGCGKSTLIKMILSKEENQNIKLGTNIQIGYIPQEIYFSDENKTILEEVRTFFYGGESELRALLARYYFSSFDILKRLKDISGGEKVRIKLLELILKGDNLLIFDEPTNHIDITTKEILERAIMDYGGTVIFVSHDRYFIDKIATKLLVCEDNTIIEFNGNYSEYKNISL